MRCAFFSYLLSNFRPQSPYLPRQIGISSADMPRVAQGGRAVCAEGGHQQGGPAAQVGGGHGGTAQP